LTRSSSDRPPAGTPGVRGFLKALRGNLVLASFLVFIPGGFVSKYQDWPDWSIFTCNFFAILPMAWLIGKSTEDLASSTGDVLGGLLNATFGNVVEMLLCVAGIRQGEIAVVQCTLIGSILSNMLLVLGTAFMWGGLFYHTQTFSPHGAKTQTSLMMLAAMGTVLPTCYSILSPDGPGEARATRTMSLWCAVFQLMMYCQYLLFMMKTHTFFFESEEQESMKEENSESVDDDEDVDMTPRTATVVLAVCTILTSFCTEYLITSIQGTVHRWKVSKEFIGIVILPIIGNAAEHYTAIIVAGRDKIDLSLGVAVGSSCQMALLVTPFTVFAGWVFEQPMTLDFHPFQVSVLFMSVLIVAQVLKDGKCHWLMGSMLVSAYASIALIYWYEGRGELMLRQHANVQ